MEHWRVVKDTGLRRLLFGVDEAPELRFGIRRVEINLSGAVPVAQVNGDLASEDDEAPVMAVFQFEPIALGTSRLPMHVAQYLHGNGRELPDALKPAVEEAVQREVLRVFPGATQEPKQVFDVLRSVTFVREGTKYACDHNTWTSEA